MTENGRSEKILCSSIRMNSGQIMVRHASQREKMSRLTPTLSGSEISYFSSNIFHDLNFKQNLLAGKSFLENSSILKESLPTS